MSGINVPLIGKTEQKLIITCRKKDNGEGEILFAFDPPFEVAASPEEQAALNIANTVIDVFKLGQEEEIK